MQKRVAGWALFAALAIGSAFFMLAFVLEVIAVVSGNLDKGDTRAAATGGAVFLFVLSALLAWASRVVEHRVRTNHGGASPSPSLSPSPSGWSSGAGVAAGLGASEGSDAFPGTGYEGPVRGYPPPPPPMGAPLPMAPPVSMTSAYGDPLPPTGTSRSSRWKSISTGHRRRNTPHAQLVSLIVFGLLALVFFLAGISGISDANKSSSVQHHGIPATGVLTNVDVVTHDQKGGSYTTVDLDVSLAPPVLGQSLITVDTPDRTAPANVGDRIQILVDRSDPTYAELPGQPDNTIGGAIFCLVLSVLMMASAVAATVSYRRHRARLAGMLN